MPKKKFIFASLLLLLIALVPAQINFAQSDAVTLKKGMSGFEVSKLQKDLKTLGFFNSNPTGYFGDITETAVINFQKRYNLQVDGVAGEQTFKQINKLLKRTPNNSRGANVRGESTRTNSKGISLMPWFESVDRIFSIGKVASVTDVNTGLKLKVQRTYGTNHADVETLTSKDTEILRKIAGGTWNWIRRPAIVEVDGYKIAASITAMPHAGRDDKPANAIVNGRSGGYGRGENLDAVKGNGMDGHFDIHFLNSRTHGTNRVDEKHQEMVRKAYESGE